MRRWKFPQPATGHHDFPGRLSQTMQTLKMSRFLQQTYMYPYDNIYHSSRYFQMYYIQLINVVKTPKNYQKEIIKSKQEEMATGAKTSEGNYKQ